MEHERFWTLDRVGWAKVEQNFCRLWLLMGLALEHEV